MAYSKKRVKSSVGVFVKRYKRKSHKGFDPNDRSYDRKLEKIINEDESRGIVETDE